MSVFVQNYGQFTDSSKSSSSWQKPSKPPTVICKCMHHSYASLSPFPFKYPSLFLMDPKNMQGGMYPNMGSGMLGLEMSLHHHPQNPQHPQIQSNQQSPSFLGHQMSPYSQQEANFRNPNRPFPPQSTPQQVVVSDEDEDSNDGKKRVTASPSPWQRMKWTDNMVRLLILVVYYIGDEGGPEGGEVAVKKKGATVASGGGVLQKKGKWKSVSMAMLERGFYVSPQQCEDKFNDLNKRYKRVNDILGKGTACRVVENQSLLDSMDLTAKKKEEVKKLLNSKHLFFKEMCAYHTSCAASGGGSGGCGSTGSHLPEHAAEHPAPLPLQQRGCLHGSEDANFGAFSDRKEEIDDDDNDDGEDDDDGVDEEGHDDDDYEECSKKRAKIGGLANQPLMQQLSGDVARVVQDMSKSAVEKKEWVKSRMVQLEEKRVGIQLEAVEIEKQRLKWLKFSSKKERELERDKLQNERTKLEIDRTILVLRQKELELLDRKQCSNVTG